jgi:hypothetical protein
VTSQVVRSRAIAASARPSPVVSLASGNVDGVRIEYEAERVAAWVGAHVNSSTQPDRRLAGGRKVRDCARFERGEDLLRLSRRRRRMGKLVFSALGRSHPSGVIAASFRSAHASSS